MLGLHRKLRTWDRHVDLFIAPSEFARAEFVSAGFPPEKVIVKSNFIHPDPGCAEGLGFYALYVGRLSREKGVETLLEAWTKIKGVELRIAGDGPLCRETRFMERMISAKNVTYLGHLDRKGVIEELAGSFCLVFPSELFETFGMSVAEAFASGIPTIVSDIGAVREMVREGETGLFFRAGDADELALKVMWAKDRREEMARMGKAARSVFEEKYSQAKNYEELMGIYEQAIGTHASR
jgi:glycosyltransferase involved in cell wall biosynthesis